jgi:Flp pilus assembly protein TadB
LVIDFETLDSKNTDVQSARKQGVNQKRMPQHGKRRPDPEIIPPGDARQDIHRTRIYVDARDTEWVDGARIGPFGFILVVVITALLLAMLLALLLATLLIWLPLVVLFVAGAIIVRILRVYFTQAQ